MFKDRRRVLALALVAAFAFMAISPIFGTAQVFVVPGDEKTGPYVDKIVYNVIEGDDQQVLALQNDEIDLIGDMVDPTHLPTLEDADNIEVANVRRNGYGYVTIKTDKYPFNITDFRRALAFALDKQAISDDAWDGLSDPQDSCVPVVNPFSCEGLLPYTYYEANVELGNAMLDAAGFTIDPVTNYRLAPNGDPFDVLVECAQSSNIAIEVGQKVADALTALHVDAVSQPTDFYEYLNRLYFHGDYDIVFLGSSFNNFDVDWLAYEFWSEFAYEDYYNFPCWQNATYDSWRDQLLHATEYEDVYEAAFKMQEIWVHSSPMIICYENFLLSAYRTDKFEGLVNDVSDGVPGWWTNYKVHLKPGQIGAPWGGEFRWSNPLDLDTFNFMTSSSAYTMNVLQMLYDSLMTVDSAGNDILWLAESYLAETHADNPAVPEGYTRFTFDMKQNGKWTDGTPITAEDVAYSLNYFRDSPGNPYGPDLTEMTAAYAPTTYRLIVEFSSESYWHLHTVAYKTIIPKHFFLTIGLEGWNTWDPQPPTEGMITSGPFNVSDYVAGEFCELTYYEDYFYSIDRDEVWPTDTNTAPTTTTGGTTTTTGPVVTTDTTTSTTEPPTSTPTPVPQDFTMAIVAGAVGAAVVILVGGYVLLRQK
jgi:peptide/nickel transport system substrate-binding protein